MDDDILGGRTLPIVRGTESGHWSDLSFSIKTASILGLVLLACVALAHAWERFLRWQEAVYKLSMRRRHGIPDTDHRPFNVAYAAVTRARQDREAKAKLPIPEKAPALVDAQSIRQRFSDAGATRNMAGAWSSTATAYYANSGAGPSSARNYPTPSPTDPLNFAERYNPNPPSVRIPDSDPQHGPTKHNGTSRWPSRSLNFTVDATHDRRKRVLDDDDDLEPVKKTRVEGEELIDGEEDAEWQQPSDRRNAGGVDGRTQRGSKRVLGEDDCDTTESTRTRDKRARKVLRDRTPEDQIMVDEGSDGDEPTDLISISRGRKRDRAEAGSTFGGDDSELALDEEDGGKNSRRRKRRTVMKRKSDAHSRGQKRDRDAQSHGSDSEEDENRVKKRTSRKRKGKNDVKEEAGSDVSMADSQISQDPLCKGRRIGEEWEANGFQWKVGLNGDRLRQALVKKARSKFVMPKDSQHPDREANLEVFIESWLTEDQYKEAQERHELAWQDSPKPSVEPETPGNVPDSPLKPGKNLLWESTALKDGSTPKRGPFRQSIATNLGIRINPFHQSQYGPSRRVASSYVSPVTATGDGINAAGNPKHRAFSKWEKQDLEAQAMAKMRAKAQEEKAKQVAAATSEVKKPVGIGGASTTAQVPPLSFPAPPVEKPAPMPTFGAIPATTNEVKATETAKPAPIQPEAATFKLPTVMAAAPKPFFTVPQNSQPAAPSSSSASNGAPAPPASFSFGTQPAKLQQPTPAANSTSSSLTVPSGGATRPSSPAAPAFTQPVPTPVQQNAAPKPPMFSFAPPSNRGPSPQFSLGAQGAKTTTSAFGTLQNDASKKSEEKFGDSGSLMSRMGAFGGSQSSQPTTSALASFSGGNKPAAPATGGDPIKPSAFGVSTTPHGTPAASTTVPAASGTGASSTIKFNFGVKPTSAQSNLIPAASSASAPSAATPDNPKPPSTLFTFGASSTPTPKPIAAAAPKFNFPPPSSSTFGSTSSLEGGKSATPVPSASSQNQAKTFGGFGSGGAGGFSAAPAALPSFGGGGNVFGGSGATPAQSNQSTPSAFPSTGAFGNLPASSSSGTEAPKSAFSFNTKPAEPSKTTFTFGQPSNSNTSTDPQILTSVTGTQPPANNSSAPAPTPSAFGFPSTPGTGFTFGQPPK